MDKKRHNKPSHQLAVSTLPKSESDHPVVFPPLPPSLSATKHRSPSRPPPSLPKTPRRPPPNNALPAPPRVPLPPTPLLNPPQRLPHPGHHPHQPLHPRDPRAPPALRVPRQLPQRVPQIRERDTRARHALGDRAAAGLVRARDEGEIGV